MNQRRPLHSISKKYSRSNSMNYPHSNQHEHILRIKESVQRYFGIIIYLLENQNSINRNYYQCNNIILTELESPIVN
jgi:hypothetical protein